MVSEFYLSLALCGAVLAGPPNTTPPVIDQYKTDMCRLQDYWLPKIKKEGYRNDQTQLFECQFIMRLKKYKCYSELLDQPECIGKILSRRFYRCQRCLIDALNKKHG
jgi:hypothetical protein